MYYNNTHNKMSEILHKKIIAFDIDGTLFYTSKKKFNDSIKMELSSIVHYVKIRPHLNLLFEYLDLNKEHFQFIVYSAARMDYVKKLIDLIDKKNLITEVYDRQFCDVLYIGGKTRYIKNCKKINKNLHNLYLIDDNDDHFNNYDVIGYKCKKFKGQKEDNEIFNIIDFLNMLKVIQ